MMFAVKTKVWAVKHPSATRKNALPPVSREAELFMQKVAKVREAEENFSKLWTECQRCQGSMHQDVMCSK